MKLRQGSEAYKQRELLVAAARAYKAEGHSHDEVAEKFGKSTAWSITWCKGISPQGMRPVKHLRNQYTNGECDRVALAIKQINRFNSDWEYVGGFTSCDGRVDIRCKKCGTVSNYSLITMRHKHCVCSTCNPPIQKPKPQAESCKKAKQRQVKSAEVFNRGQQLGFAFCESCGGLIPPGSTRRCAACRTNLKHRRWNVKKERRRKAAFTKESGSISLQALVLRDNGICWLCGKPCNIDADSNDNEYPSIDHVVPISKGGKDEWSNIKLAHRLCNSLRGNKV